MAAIDFRETVHVVIATCRELLYSQMIAAFTSDEEARSFVGRQEEWFELHEFMNQSPTWLPASVIREAHAAAGREKPAPIHTASFAYVVRELPWNQMLGRFVPKTSDGFPGPILEAPPGSSAPEATPVFAVELGAAASIGDVARVMAAVIGSTPSGFGSGELTFHSLDGSRQRATIQADVSGRVQVSIGSPVTSRAQQSAAPPAPNAKQRETERWAELARRLK